jgi:glycosyltransferase involved in cell wall biosynthesis
LPARRQAQSSWTACASGEQHLSVSLILTTYNEAAPIGELLASIGRQERPPDEVVVVDGGSRDDTVARLEAHADRLPLRVLVCPGLNIAAGRNAAIRAATGEIIAVTDAGVRQEPGWLQALLRPIEAGEAAVTAGFFRADPRNAFEAAMGATVLPLATEIDPARFLPSSRSVAFRKEAWARAGGYPEWLDYCEDLIFDLALREAAGPFAWAPAAIAYFRPRSNLQAFFLQYFRYARGDGKADLFRRRHAIRYASYAAGLALFTVFIRGLVASSRTMSPPAPRAHSSTTAGPIASGAAAALLVAGAMLYLRRPYQRLGDFTAGRTPLERAQMIALVPTIRLVGDVAKLAGYPAGVRWRLGRRTSSRGAGSRGTPP